MSRASPSTPTFQTSSAPFHTKVIAATASEAPHVLDGLLYPPSTAPTLAALPIIFLGSATCLDSVSRLACATSRIGACICYRA
jgi:hypothetical protein